MLSLTAFIKGILARNENDQTKGLSIEVDDTATTSTQTTLKSKQTADRTLDLPDAGGELVEKDHTQTLTNKSIDADTNTITNLRDAEIAADADITRIKLAPGTVDHVLINDPSGEISSEAQLDPSRGGLGLDLSAAQGTIQFDAGVASIKQLEIDDTDATNKTTLDVNSTADRILVLPDADDTLVARDTTDTLTNKTIGDDLAIQGTTSSTDASTGALTVAGGAGITENLNVGADAAVGGNLTVTGDLTVNGTTTTINTATVSTEDANIELNRSGDQAAADLQKSGITVQMSDATDARVGYDSTKASKFVAGEVGSEKEILTDADTQTVTNKTIDASSNTITNLTHGTEVDNPSSGVHGVVGSVVGTTDTQTLTNKTLTSPTIGTNSTYDNQAEARFLEQTGNGTNYVGFEAPDAVTSNQIWKLPDGDGVAGQFLKTNGTGDLSWDNDGQLAISTKTNADSPYTVLTSDEVLLIDASSGAVTLNLYAASGNEGKTLKVKLIDATNPVTIDGNGAETIEGNLTLVLSATDETVDLICDGSNFRILNKDLTSFVESDSGGLVAYGITVAQWGDLTSLSLDPGEWELTGMATLRGGSGFGPIQIQLGIGSTSGNNVPQPFGINRVSQTTRNQTGLDDDHSLSIPIVRATLTSTTTYYLKYIIDANIGTGTTISYKLSARRIR